MKVRLLAPSLSLTAFQKKQLKLLRGSGDILAIDPDYFGGFEKAKARVTGLAKRLPNLKGLALTTTSYGWIDLAYFKARRIPVCNIPGYSREAVAEHTLALLLGLAKRIMVTDRQTQKGQYKPEMGFEIKGKTLGIIGLGNIGSRVAELALGIGMKVIAYNRSPRRQKGVKMVKFDQLLKQSDAISLYVIDCEQTRNLIDKKTLALIKSGVIIVNTADRKVVNESDMAAAIKTGQVYGYAYEAEDLKHTPLAKLENAVGIKGFGWYTKEALERLTQIWVDNIVAIAKGKPQNVVN
jgi:lactate dehydrogenase-like 2-hydroxyacid dehydrogenase